MTTAQDVIEAGYARSTLNDPGKLAGDLELINFLNRRYQLRFALLASASGDDMLASTALYFAGAPPFSTLPADIIDLIRLQDAGGGKVHIIPVDERDRSWHIAPAVHRQGLTIVSRNKTGDPGPGSSLVLYYLDAPTPLVGLASALDARYPARWEGLLINDVAVYLSIKDDGRVETEYKQLMADVAGDERAFNLLVYGSATAKERPVPQQVIGKQ